METLRSALDATARGDSGTVARHKNLYPHSIQSNPEQCKQAAN